MLLVNYIKKKIKNNKKQWDNWKIVMVDKIGKKLSSMKKEKEYDDDDDDMK